MKYKNTIKISGIKNRSSMEPLFNNSLRCLTIKILIRDFNLRLLKTLLFILITILYSCDGCDRENPRVMLVNNGTGKADIQIKTSEGNTENINNIQPGTSSERRSFAPGEIKFTIAIQGVKDPVEYNLYTSYCYDYTVTINSDNSVSATANPRD